MKKSLPIIVLGVAILLLGASFWLRLRLRPRLRVENFRHVHPGLTQRDVERLLGGPPGNFGLGWGHGMMTLENFTGPRGSVERVWKDDSTRFEIYFDSHDVVVSSYKRAGYHQTRPEEYLANAWQWVVRRVGF